MVLINLDGHEFSLDTEEIGESVIEEIKRHVSYIEPTLANNFYLTQNGRLLDNDMPIRRGIIYVVPRLPGGKGGFGSMLRAIGAQIEKTTNREACRDLSGRRLRDINEEKRLKKWISQQAEREKEAEERKKKKLEKLSYEPKHEFNDSEYDKVRSEMVDKVHCAVEQGLQASTSASQEPSTSGGIKRKKKNAEKPKGMLWIDDELGSDSSEEASENEEQDGCKKQKRDILESEEGTEKECIVSAGSSL